MSRGKRHRIYVDRSARHSARRDADYLYTWMTRRRFDGRPIKLGGRPSEIRVRPWLSTPRVAADPQEQRGRNRAVKSGEDPSGKSPAWAEPEVDGAGT